MKAEMRRELARESFEEKIRKVGELIQLSRKLKAQRVRETAEPYPQSARSLPVLVAVATAAGNPHSIQLPLKNSKK